MVAGIAAKRRVILSRGNSFAVCSSAQLSSVQFSSRWYLSARKSPDALLPVSPKFLQTLPLTETVFSVHFGKRLRLCKTVVVGFCLFVCFGVVFCHSFVVVFSSMADEMREKKLTDVVECEREKKKKKKNAKKQRVCHQSAE